VFRAAALLLFEFKRGFPQIHRQLSFLPVDGRGKLSGVIKFPHPPRDLQASQHPPVGDKGQIESAAEGLFHISTAHY